MKDQEDLDITKIGDSKEKNLTEKKEEEKENDGSPKPPKLNEEMEPEDSQDKGGQEKVREHLTAKSKPCDESRPLV